MKKYPQYSAKQKWIHWLTAILVIIAILLPLMRVSLSPYLGGMANLFTLHKSLGVILFLITIWRILVIKKEGIPKVLPKQQKLQRILSKSVQGIMYIILLFLPLSGYLMSGRSLDFLGFISIPALGLPNNIAMFFHSTHIVLAYILMVLICLHILAALYHHFGAKDDVLKSMLPNNWFN